MSTEQETLFQENPGRTARLLAYGLVAIVMMAADHRGHYLTKVRAWSAHLLIPVYESVGLPFHGLEQAGLYFQQQSDLQAQLQQLREENLRLKAQTQLINQLHSDNNQLRELLGAQRRRSLEVVYTELVRIDLDPYSHRVVINRGSDAGVAVGQAVMDAEGVFGQVEQVSRGGAEVILISDPNHALPVQINRTGMRTLAYGTGNPNHLVLPDLPLNTDIRQGDRIVTSGLGGHFHPGLPVAIVTSVDRATQGDFISARARPVAGLDRSAQLLVILNPQRQSATPANQGAANRSGSATTSGAAPDDATTSGETRNASNHPATPATTPANAGEAAANTNLTADESATPAEEQP